MNKKSHELELERLWKSRQAAARSNKLRECAPEEEGEIPYYLRGAINKTGRDPKQKSEPVAHDYCSPEKVRSFLNVPDNEVVIDLSDWAGLSETEKARTVTAGMMRSLLDAIRSDADAMWILDDLFQVTNVSMEGGKTQEQHEQTWQASVRMLDLLMVRLFGIELARSTAGIKLRNVVISFLSNEAAVNCVEKND